MPTSTSDLAGLATNLLSLMDTVQAQVTAVSTFTGQQIALFTTQDATVTINDAEGHPVILPSYKTIVTNTGSDLIDPEMFAGNAGSTQSTLGYFNAATAKQLLNIHVADIADLVTVTAFSDLTGNIGSGQIATGTITLGMMAVAPPRTVIGNAGSISGTASYLTVTDLKTMLQYAAVDITGLAASATSDTTNAANIVSGRLNGMPRLPAIADGTLLGNVSGSTGSITALNLSSVYSFLEVGIANGLAPLDSTGVVSYSHLPSDIGNMAGITVITDGTLAGNSDSHIPSEKAVKTYVDAAVGSGGAVSSVIALTGAITRSALITALALTTGNISDIGTVATSAKITDGTLSGNSNTNIPTEQAVKTYVDTAIAGVGGGAVDSVAGLVGAITAPDLVTALALVAANISDLGTVATLAATTDGTLSGNSDALVPSEQAVKTYVDTAIGTVVSTVAGLSGPTILAADLATALSLAMSNITDIGTAAGLASTTDGTLSGDSDALLPTERAVKTYVDTAIGTVVTTVAGLSGPNIIAADLTAALALTMANITDIGSAAGLSALTDGTLSGNSDLALPTQQAVKTYVDTAIAASVTSIAGLTGAVTGADLVTTLALSTANITDIGTVASLASSIDGTLAGNSNANVPTEQAVKTYVDTAITGVTSTLGTASGLAFDTDGTLFADADTAVATQKAVKTYVDAQIAAVTGAGGGTVASVAGLTGVITGAGLKSALALTTADVTGSGVLTMSNQIDEFQATAIASAASVGIGAAGGNFVHITGTVTITSFDTAQAGVERTVTFDGALTLTHNSTSLILPTGANIVTAAKDCAVFRSEGGGNWRCISYQRNTGVSLTQWTPSVQSVASNATLTPTYTNNLVRMTAAAVNVTIANPTGTAVDGHTWIFRITDNGSARTLSWGTIYLGVGGALPSTTTAGKHLVFEAYYDSSLTKVVVLCPGYTQP